MHSSHQSRGRIFFEVLCALAVSVSCVGIWMQTFASAALGVAATAMLYGFVRAFDMARSGRPAGLQQRVPATASAPPEATELPASGAIQVFDAKEAEPAVSPRARKPRQPKAPRKAGKGRSGVTASAAPIEILAEGEPEPGSVQPVDDAVHPSPTPLFEPEPFVRQQRPAFGRRGRLSFGH